MNTNENTHEPLVDRALVGFDLAAEHHLANCQPCQQERERVEEALRLFRAANREYANRPESFWEQQALRIRAARSDRARKSRAALTLTPGLAVLLLVGAALVSRVPSSRPQPIVVNPPVAQATPVGLSDHELLLEVERAVQSDTPLSLEPAMLMVEENDSSMPLNSSNARKEPHTHEN
jgi:hypothetical protein